MNILRTHRHRTPVVSTGFSLLEVLVAVVVLSVGLLGLASLQLSALRNNNQSYERSQALALAYDIADAMRSNRAEAIAGAFEITADKKPTVKKSCIAALCTRTEAAAFALGSWAERLRVELPSGAARIACSTSPCVAGRMHTVVVMWDENRTGATGTTCPAPAAFNPANDLSCVQLSVVP